MAVESAVPMSGTISGAMSMAPMTTAVDSTTTPTEAMTEAKSISVRNRTNRTAEVGPSK
jgi:hypothetical protein